MHTCPRERRTAESVEAAPGSKVAEIFFGFKLWALRNPGGFIIRYSIGRLLFYLGHELLAILLLLGVVSSGIGSGVSLKVRGIFNGS